MSLYDVIITAILAVTILAIVAIMRPKTFRIGIANRATLDITSGDENVGKGK